MSLKASQTHVEAGSSKIEIVTDKWGVPHVYAADFASLAFGLGYTQARDRLWQMDFNRRAAKGRLSEVFGEPTLQLDRLARYVGFERLALAEEPQLKTDEKTLLQGFKDGVNRYVETHRDDLPLEFSILKAPPRPWSLTDTLAFSHFMSWTFIGNWNGELVRHWTFEKYGKDVLRIMGTGYPEGRPVIVPAGGLSRAPRQAMDREFEKLEELVTVPGQMMSNNWVVDGNKSATGSPLLANDPHIPLQMPSIWYEMHMHSPDIQAMGATLPGIPGVIIGHNGHIAWGLTNSVADTSDLFIEKLSGSHNKTRYLDRIVWKEAEVFREEITVRGRSEAVVENVSVTKHGPVIGPLFSGEPRSIALQSVLPEARNRVRSLMLLWKARDWSMFRDALKHWTAPALNFVYADTHGNIGYQLAGLVPVRARGNGLLPSPGWTGDYDWTGFIPFDKMPNEYNPSTHWIATANNKTVNEDYPYFIGFGGDPYRISRIVQLLKMKEKLSAADFKAIQTDLYSIPAKEIVEIVGKLDPTDDRAKMALDYLKAWDFVLSPESVPASIFEVFVTVLSRRALQEKLDKESSEVYLGKPGKRSQVFWVRVSWLLAKITEYPNWFGTTTWATVMEESLVSAVEELTRLLGKDMAEWKWKRLHLQAFTHPLGHAPELSSMFNRGPVPVGGDDETVWASAYIPHDGYAATYTGVSYRLIVDLGSLDNSFAVHPTGQSGNPKSAHYDDMIELWRNGEYHPLLWTKEEVEKAAETREKLDPT